MSISKGTISYQVCACILIRPNRQKITLFVIQYYPVWHKMYSVVYRKERCFWMGNFITNYITTIINFYHIGIIYLARKTTRNHPWIIFYIYFTYYIWQIRIHVEEKFFMYIDVTAFHSILVYFQWSWECRFRTDKKN